MAGTDTVSAPGAETQAEEATFAVGDESWTARTLGRSGGGEAPQLLLVGFWREEAQEGDHMREALVVARSLSELSSDALSTALARSREPPAPPGAPPTREDRRRGRRR
jgi:hypothetical protein